MDLKEFILEKHPSIIDEFRRLTTPNYYETGVLYYPLTSGFGTSHGGNKNKHLTIIGWDISKEKLYMTLKEVGGDSKYSVYIDEAYKKLARVDENAICKFNVNIVSGTRYLTHNGQDYEINLMVFEDYHTKKTNMRMLIRRKSDIPVNVWGKLYRPHYEIYSVIGRGSIVYKYVHGYDSVAREKYDIKFNQSVKQVKKLIFGDEKVKIPMLPDVKIFKDFDKYFIK